MKNISLPFKIIGSLWKAKKLIKQFQPDVVVGVGGYASGPVMYMAHRLKVPVLIQEQNSFAGATNKLMRDKAQKFCVAYDGMDKFFPQEKIIKTGNPVRQNIVEMKSDKAKSLAAFGLQEGRRTILVIGGSLGARTINESVVRGFGVLQEMNVQVLWQTGKTYFEKAKEQAANFQNVKVHEFIKNMDAAYDAADIIISRAGAIAISELCLIGKPVILVPSPNVAEDHQTKNAMALVEKNAALMVKDADARKELINVLLKLKDDAVLQQTLSLNILKLGIPDAAERIAREALGLVSR